ncbi:MAG TPA: hypothetical protein VJS43_03740 [Candidatus Acidoferrales bacterium]|nr:hypothetical protein [Candidatus Acidoferrales bacterium]
MTEQLLHGIRGTGAKVVVIDITGVAAMGATVIVTGLSPESRRHWLQCS